MRTAEIIISRDDNNRIVGISIDNLPLFEKKYDDGGFAYLIPQLKVLGYSQKGKDDAYRRLEKSLRLFFEVHITRNTVEFALGKLGWEMPHIKESHKLSNSIPSYLTNAPKHKKHLEFA